MNKSKGFSRLNAKFENFFFIFKTNIERSLNHFFLYSQVRCRNNSSVLPLVGESFSDLNLEHFAHVSSQNEKRLSIQNELKGFT